MKVLGLEINWVQISEARVGYYALQIFQNLFLKWVIYANSTKLIRCDRVVLERSVSLSSLNHPAAVCTGLGPGDHPCVPFISNHLLRWFYALKIHQCTVCRWRACNQLVCWLQLLRKLTSRVTWDNNLISLSLEFFVYKMELTAPPSGCSKVWMSSCIMHIKCLEECTMNTR